MSELFLLVPDASCDGALSKEQDGHEDKTDAGVSTAPVLTGIPVPNTDIEARRAVSFEQFLEEPRTKTHKFWEGDLGVIFCLDDSVQLKEEILDCKEPAPFLRLKDKWQKCEKACAQVVKGIKQSADDLAKRLKVKVSEEKREQKRKQEQEAKDQLQKVRAEAKAAADAIKKRRLSQDSQCPPLFTTSLDATKAKEVQEIKDPAAVMAEWGADFPWFKTGGEEVELNMGSNPMSKTLANWGGQYKRSLANLKLDVVTFPLEEKTGSTQVNTLFESVLPSTFRPDISSVAGGQSFMDAAWLFGCSADLKSVGFNPNGAGLLKVLAVGEVQHILLEWAGVKKFLEKIEKDKSGERKSSREDLLGQLKCLTEEQVKQLCEDTVVRQHTLKAKEILFIPMGWVAVEIAGNHPFLYGFRKSVFTTGATGVAAYEDALEAAKASGKAVDRMSKILETLKVKK